MNRKKIFSAVLAVAFAVTAANTFDDPIGFAEDADAVAAAAETTYKAGDEVKLTNICLRFRDDNTWEVFHENEGSSITCPSANLTAEHFPENLMYKGYPVTRIADSGFGSDCALNSIDIPEGITSIGVNAFRSKGPYGLYRVTIPETVTSIGNNAFNGSSFTEVTLPSKITRIEDGTFDTCKALTTINIPSGVTYIGASAFASCETLSSVALPQGLTEIGANAFGRCKVVKISKIPDSVTKIGDLAFYACHGLTEVIIPDSVTGDNFGEEVFKFSDSLTTVVLPDHFTSIPKGTFNDCDKLSSFTIPKSVTAIGAEAFYRCKALKSIVIPKSVTMIETNAFAGSGLTDIYYEGSKTEWDENVTSGNSGISTGVTMHYNYKEPTGVPVNVEINAPAGVDVGEQKAEAADSKGNKAAISIVGGRIDVSGLSDGDYTFTFSAKNCAPRPYEVKVASGKAVGLSEVKLNLYGDVDGNGEIGLGDVMKVNASARNSKVLTGYDAAVADINGDGEVALVDLMKINAHAKRAKLLW